MCVCARFVRWYECARSCDSCCRVHSTRLRGGDDWNRAVGWRRREERRRAAQNLERQQICVAAERQEGDRERSEDENRRAQHHGRQFVPISTARKGNFIVMCWYNSRSFSIHDINIIFQSPRFLFKKSIFQYKKIIGCELFGSRFVQSVARDRARRCRSWRHEFARDARSAHQNARRREEGIDGDKRQTVRATWARTTERFARGDFFWNIRAHLECVELKSCRFCFCFCFLAWCVALSRASEARRATECAEEETSLATIRTSTNESARSKSIKLCVFCCCWSLPKTKKHTQKDEMSKHEARQTELKNLVSLFSERVDNWLSHYFWNRPCHFRNKS